MVLKAKEMIEVAHVRVILNNRYYCKLTCHYQPFFLNFVIIQSSLPIPPISELTKKQRYSETGGERSHIA